GAGAGTGTGGTAAGPASGAAAVTVVERADDTGGHPDVVPPVRLDLARSLTLLGILSLVAGALFFDLNVGLTALTVAAVLALVSPKSAEGAAEKCAWTTVLLVCGIVTYVNLLQHLGTVDWLGEKVSAIEAPLLAALLICLIAAVVAAFASTTGILGALIPLAVPLLQDGRLGALTLISAMAICASVVDSSPFSTSGALVAANTPEEQRDYVFRSLMTWGFALIPLAPLTACAVLVLPGW
ncbi:SLC13 family permease, partial [Streptomyces boncukensis]